MQRARSPLYTLTRRSHLNVHIRHLYRYPSATLAFCQIATSPIANTCRSITTRLRRETRSAFMQSGCSLQGSPWPFAETREILQLLGKAEVPERQRSVGWEEYLIYLCVYIIAPLLARSRVLHLYLRLGSDSGNSAINWGSVRNAVWTTVFRGPARKCLMNS